jgi:hypothetical protein
LPIFALQVLIPDKQIYLVLERNLQRLLKFFEEDIRYEAKVLNNGAAAIGLTSPLESYAAMQLCLRHIGDLTQGELNLM